MIGLIMFGLFVKSADGQDKWAYFQPELVHSYGCNVRNTMLILNGVSGGEIVWMATAHAERTDGSWQQDVAHYPYTVKGRHKAEAACRKWQDEAEKRVNAVQPK